MLMKRASGTQKAQLQNIRDALALLGPLTPINGAPEEMPVNGAKDDQCHDRQLTRIQTSQVGPISM